MWARRTRVSSSPDSPPLPLPQRPRRPPQPQEAALKWVIRPVICLVCDQQMASSSQRSLRHFPRHKSRWQKASCSVTIRTRRSAWSALRFSSRKRLPNSWRGCMCVRSTKQPVPNRGARLLYLRCGICKHVSELDQLSWSSRHRVSSLAPTTLWLSL